LNAISDESTSWNEPSYSSIFTSSDRIAGEDAARQRFLDALVDRLDVFLRNRAADDLVLEHIAGARLRGIQMDLRVAVLPAAAGLPDVAPLAIGRTRERFLVGNLRLADARLDTELALQAVDDDFEVQLAHAAMTTWPVCSSVLHAERRILRHQLGEP
jgi:hypothetical protein